MSDISDKARSIQREYLRSWRKQHPEKVRAYNQNYWARKAEKAAAQREEGQHGTK